MVFCFIQNFFFQTTQELEYLFFFVARSTNFFFQNITLGYMTKTLNQINIFFPPPKSEYFFQQQWESEYFFRKNHNPPLQVKWSFPNLLRCILAKMTKKSTR